MSAFMFPSRGLVVTIVLALAPAVMTLGCASDLETPASPAVGSGKPGGVPDDMPLCRTLTAALQGRDGAVFEVTDSGGLLAVDVNDIIVCVDNAQGVLVSGVNPVTSVANKPTNGGFIEGTPLPAAIIRTMAGE
jgi:hypothetical protein